jgi:hypothetical protein
LSLCRPFCLGVLGFCLNGRSWDYRAEFWDEAVHLDWEEFKWPGVGGLFTGALHYRGGGKDGFGTNAIVVGVV